MPRKYGPVLSLALLLFLILSTAEAQRKGQRQQETLPATSTFNVLKDILSSEIRSAEEVEDALTASGLKKRSDVATDVAWELKSTEGFLQLLAFPKAKSFYMTFVPASHNRMSASVLAALIAKSESIGFEDADTVEIVLPAEERRSATLRHALVISLNDEAWVGSKVSIFSGAK